MGDYFLMMGLMAVLVAFCAALVFGCRVAFSGIKERRRWQKSVNRGGKV